MPLIWICCLFYNLFSFAESVPAAWFRETSDRFWNSGNGIFAFKCYFLLNSLWDLIPILSFFISFHLFLQWFQEGQLWLKWSWLEHRSLSSSWGSDCGYSSTFSKFTLLSIWGTFMETLIETGYSIPLCFQLRLETLYLSTMRAVWFRPIVKFRDRVASN